MTIIVGLKDQVNQVWVSSDSRISYGSTKIDISPNSTDSKLIYLTHAIIGCAGLMGFRNYLELFIDKKKARKNYPFEDKISVLKFFNEFNKFLKESIFLGNDVGSHKEAEWLVLTKDKIYTVDMDGATLEIDKMGAIGSGQYTSLAILDYIHLHQPNLSPEDALKRTYDATTNREMDCGGNQILFNVTQFLTPTC